MVHKTMNGTTESEKVKPKHLDVPQGGKAHLLHVNRWGSEFKIHTQVKEIFPEDVLFLNSIVTFNAVAENDLHSSKHRDFDRLL